MAFLNISTAKRLCIGTALALGAGLAQAATVVFQPTDQNVNFIQILASGTATSQLGLFDDSVVDGSGNAVIGSGTLFLPVDFAGDVVSFSPVIGQATNYTVTNNNLDTFGLSNSDHFVLAARKSPTDAWMSASDTTTVCNGASGSCTVSWSFVGAGGGLTELVVDVKVATTSPVPVPAAVWLLGSGLLGLVGVGRRRRTV